MFRLSMACLFAFTLVSSAAAQGGGKPIQWLTNLEKAFDAAKQHQRPLMIYVTGGSTTEGSDLNNLENEQEAGLRNAEIVKLAHTRFVPVRISLTSQTVKSLEQLGLPTRYGLYIAFVGTDGKLIREVPPGGVARVATMLQVMGEVMKVQRTKLFDSELKPILADAARKSPEIIQALKTIKEQEIVEADVTIGELLKREGIGADVVNAAYDTLATLSSKVAIDALILRTRAGDAAAAKALQDANPRAAEQMLEYLADANPAFQFAVYEAVTKIAKVKATKPAKWWEKAKENMKKQEIERVRELVRTYSKKWQEATGR